MDLSFEIRLLQLIFGLFCQQAPCLCEPGAAVKHPSAKLGGFLGLKHQTQSVSGWMGAACPVPREGAGVAVVPSGQSCLGAG